MPVQVESAQSESVQLQNSQSQNLVAEPRQDAPMRSAQLGPEFRQGMGLRADRQFDLVAKLFHQNMAS